MWWGSNAGECSLGLAPPTTNSQISTNKAICAIVGLLLPALSAVAGSVDVPVAVRSLFGLTRAFLCLAGA